jgi:Zn-dependent protease with chaperone function
VIYVWHHAVTLALALVAGWSLGRASWTHRAPRLAVLLWHATLFAVLTAAVGLLLSAGLVGYGRGILPALGMLAADLATGSKPPALAAPQLLAIAAGLVLTLAVLTAQIHSARLLHRHRDRHRLLLRLVAHTDARSGALVVDHPVAAAYCVPGRSDCVVVSTGTIDALTESELAAVLAHEHAHARGHHHLALAPFHALRQVVPWGPGTRIADHVELLVEMCADDRAAHRHGATDLVSALCRFHELGHGCTPPGALAAADHAVTLRVQRLTGDRRPLRRTVGWGITLVALAVATTPGSLFLLPT